MGSEMCIRDRGLQKVAELLDDGLGIGLRLGGEFAARHAVGVEGCLLYTSDAADERSSVDLGGRRIIIKKNGERIERRCNQHQEKTHSKSQQPSTL